MRRILVALTITLLLLAPALADASLAHKRGNRPFWVHGRLSAWNGTPTFRIWVIGTTRILGVSENKNPNPDKPSMPKRLLEVFWAQPELFGTEMFADFYVEPFEPDKKGYMRPIKILKARNVVVTYLDKVVLKKSSI